MEFSAARSLQNYCEIADQSFPIQSNCPANFDVNPGIAQLVNLHTLITPLPSNFGTSLKKKVETESILETLPSPKNETEQSGAGKNFDADIQESFLHPIVTDSIEFPVSPTSSRKRLASSSSEKKAKKEKKHAHKFNVV